MSDDAGQPQVDVVIPLYNEAGHIQALCEALQRQQGRPFRVILVDNGSTDQTVALAEAYFPVYRSHKAGSYVARNYGVRQGSAPYVLFTDGDCTPDPHWVEHMALELDRGADVVAGRTVATPQGPIAETQIGRNLHKYFVEYMSRPTISQDSQGISCLFPTCNVAYRRSVLEALGEFPVEIAADLAFSQRAARQGFLCRICEQARVGHISEMTSEGIAYKLFLYSVQFPVLLPQWLAALFLIFILPLVALVYFLFIYAYRIAKAQGIGIPLSHFALFETLHLTMILCRICSKPFTVPRRVY